jgi:hypothetical protein
VLNVCSLSIAVGLTAILVVSQITIGVAASAEHRASASYRSDASNRGDTAPQLSRAGDVPPNCVRQACGKLWCWHMKNEKLGSH